MSRRSLLPAPEGTVAAASRLVVTVCLVFFRPVTPHTLIDYSDAVNVPFIHSSFFFLLQLLSRRRWWSSNPQPLE